MFVKGKSGNPSGLPKGYRHASTKIKEQFLTAFSMSGGLKALVEWIEKKDSNRKEFYKMVIQLLPKDLNLDGDGLPINITVSFEKDAIANNLQAPRFAVPSIQ